MRRNARDKECPARWVISSSSCNQPKTLMRRLLLRARQVSGVSGGNEGARLLVFVCLLADVAFLDIIYRISEDGRCLSRSASWE